MMRKSLSLLVLPLVAGCLTAHVPEVAHWSLDYKAEAEPAPKSAYGVARVTQITVRAPYDAAELAVLRADGSMSFDAYNAYAAAPMLLLRGVVYDALTASGLFSSVVNASSAVHSAVSVEVQVTRLALDCREDGAAHRVARVELLLRLVDYDGGLLKAVPATGTADAGDGRFGPAMSQALSCALERALAELR